MLPSATLDPPQAQDHRTKLTRLIRPLVWEKSSFTSVTGWLETLGLIARTLCGSFMPPMLPLSEVRLTRSPNPQARTLSLLLWSEDKANVAAPRRGPWIDVPLGTDLIHDLEQIQGDEASSSAHTDDAPTSSS
ncbi:hypothetical protein H5410_040940 [Solanum commersonii]|uniref:Uncharacterized protein n=1 Tax=Solanum commersonii TaxID=4109 RepID=A0A9J5XRK9_SOLCO|nr:hypothetical protein H5410_040940 [Solanum commersonii]